MRFLERVTPDISDMEIGATIEIAEQDGAPRSSHACQQPVRAAVAGTFRHRASSVRDGRCMVSPQGGATAD